MADGKERPASVEFGCGTLRDQGPGCSLPSGLGPQLEHARLAIGESRVSGHGMRLATRLLGAYLVVAVLTRLAESVGVHRCGCAADCWCQRSPLSLFRWVFPYGHRDVAASKRVARAASSA